MEPQRLVALQRGMPLMSTKYLIFPLQQSLLVCATVVAVPTQPHAGYITVGDERASVYVDTNNVSIVIATKTMRFDYE